MTTLDEFAAEFLAMPVSQLQAIEARNSGDRYSLVMFRRPPFQAEFVLWGPGKIVPAHNHPNIDAIGYHISGDMTMVRGKTEGETNRRLRRLPIFPADVCKEPFRALPGEWHGGKTGLTGCSFWSIQKWTEGIEITAASRDWNGPELVKPDLTKLCV